MSRWIRFLLVLSLGLAAGLYYGWVANPVQLVDTTPGMLRADFKADYVLMVAEIYPVEGDLALAARRLALLGDAPPLQYANEALAYATRAGFSPTDQGLLRTLRDALQTWNPAPEALQP